ncbi:peptidoglycan DD-metalloendopeptidase family protein [Eubacterium sp. 1001713B170207_170306_E7]|uniref:murein hydrolase activator EnvC family protein n=1 Tax=Eubacterium sp. 1001713B170207_170306_E7 TaxID=2787097 RepID=UPI00189BBBD0|nr:peptidoglycan DD-metalloendopeptidase family protein [Eubacterium sp. 1001713B170207_170306_E7]
MKKKISLIVTALFCLSIFISPVYAATKDELQQQKDDATAKKEAAQYQVDMTQNTIEGIQAEISKANAEMDKINGQINTLDGQISDLTANLERTTAELEAAEEKQAKQEEELKERVRVMYMYGNEGYMQVLFSATDFADFIAKADMMKSIVQADKDCATALEKTRAEVQEKKETIESNKTQVEQAKADQETALQSQQSIKSQKDELLAKNQQVVQQYQAEVNKQDEILNQANAELAVIAQQEAEALKARLAQEEAERQQREAEEAAQNGSSGGGSSEDSGSSGGSSNVVVSSGFMWPLPGNYTITSWFGYRPASDTNGIGSTNHGGMDIAASTGTPIHAPAGGYVTMASWNGGYGNCIMVAMDNGDTLLFGHLSGYNVSYGQRVNQGDIIGYVGSTGNSTGPHLHLTYLLNNSTSVDPWDYIYY